MASTAQTGTTKQPIAATQSTSALPAPLPAIMVSTEQAENNLTWYCQYEGVKSISVQRSADSVRNFTTIGLINAPKKGNGTYRDLHPTVGKNYYRLSIAFGGDLEWFSNTYKIILDSATIAKVQQEKAAAALAVIETMKAAEAAAQAAAEQQAASERALNALKEEARVAKLNEAAEKKAAQLEKEKAAAATAALIKAAKKVDNIAQEKTEALAEMKAKSNVDKLEKEKATPTAESKLDKKVAKKEKSNLLIEPVVAPAPFTFVPSTKIYTNPNTGHVTIKLEDAWNRRYSIRFYDPSKNEVLRISRVSKPSLVLDKNNFNSRGIYSFQLFDGSAVIDTGFVTIY
jgi:chemotaxis protein histidine kinase CheA